MAKRKSKAQIELDKTIKTYNDAIFKMVSLLTNPEEKDQFIDGLSTEQYGALRDLNVLRRDFGDDREP
jgi:hypothetical protein